MSDNKIPDRGGRRWYGRKNLAIWFCVATVVCITIWAYRPALDAPWILDDARNIVDSPALRWTELSIENVKAVLDSALLRTRPVANFSFGIDHMFWGLEPRGFHATNIAIHLAVGLALLWLSVLYVTVTSGLPTRPKSIHVALLALAPVALFLLHPLNTQAVTYVVQRMASMAALFTLIAFGCYLVARYRLTSRPAAWYAIALLAWMLGMGSKENAVLLVPIIFLYEACFFRGEWRARAEKALGGTWTSSWTLAFWVGLTVAVGIAAAMVMASSASIGLTAEFPGRDFNGLERMMTQARVQIFHLSQLVWPSPDRLNLDHHFSISRNFKSPVTTLPALLACCAFIALAAVLAVRKPVYGFPLVAYFVCHSLEAGPINLEIIFEHRMYLPMAMLFLLGPVLLVNASSRRQIRALAVVAVIAAVFAGWTHTRNLVWGDPLGLSRDMAMKSPDKPRPQYNYANALAGSDRHQEALTYIRRAIVLEPSAARHRGLLGEILTDMGRSDEAIEVYEKGMELAPDSVKLVLGLGLALEASGQEEAAFRHYLDNGIRFGSGGQPWQAIPPLKAATDLRANDAEAQSALGSAYSAAGLGEKAVEHLKSAISLDQDLYQAWFNLGVTAESLGLRDEAIVAYEGFLTHAPPDLQQAIIRARVRLEVLRGNAEP